MVDIVRQKFEYLAESDFEGQFGKYDDGEYIHARIQDAWHYFKKGWHSALNLVDEKDEKTT